MADSQRLDRCPSKTDCGDQLAGWSRRGTQFLRLVAPPHSREAGAKLTELRFSASVIGLSLEGEMPTFGRRPSERRKSQRTKGRLPAAIEFGSAPGRKGVVTDLSSIGALLEVDSVLGLPDEFHLRIHGQESRLVEVVRRDRRRIAVRFV